MKERPILFSAPMVRAILEGRKTKTRRIVKPQPAPAHGWDWSWPLPRNTPGTVTCWRGDARPIDMARYCPYGDPGDRLWVRETWADCCRATEDSFGIAYRADHADNPDVVPVRHITGGMMDIFVGRWSSPIHMPRWASRITLEITEVRVERLQEISEEDAEAEGINTSVVDPSPRGCPGGILPKQYVSARDVFADLWRVINGADSWADNPWVWVLTFKRVDQKRDEVAA